MSNYIVSNTNLTAIANAIRNKGGTAAQLAFPSGFEAAIAAIPSAQSQEWVQIPTIVKKYLDEVTYDPADTTTQISDYAPSTPDQANTKPIGKAITTDAGTLIQGEYVKTVNAGSNTLSNAIPNRSTLYGLIDSNGEVKQCGVLKPSGALRWLNTIADNVRDLGGWACDGGTVKYGRLIRGGEITALDREVLVNQCGVRAELNLLGTDSNRTTSILGDDILFERPAQFVWYSLSDHGGTAAAWIDILTFAFNCAKHSTPMYFHCTAGADRTGTVAYILETLLGVSQSDMDKDYELSSFSTSILRQRNGSGTLPALTLEINALSGSNFKQKVINWVGSLGFTADDINAFRRANIDGNPVAVAIDPVYTNLVSSSIGTDGTIFNTTGYQDGYRLNSGGMPSALTGCVCIGFIPAVQGDVIRFKGGAWNVGDTGAAFSGYCYLHECSDNAQGTVVYSHRNDQYTMTKNGDVYEYTVLHASCNYVRLNVVGSGADLIVTKNQTLL